MANKTGRFVMGKWLKFVAFFLALGSLLFGVGCINVKVQKYYYPDPNRPGEYISQWTSRVDSGGGATSQWVPEPAAEEKPKPEDSSGWWPEEPKKFEPEKMKPLSAELIPPKTTKVAPVSSATHGGNRGRESCTSIRSGETPQDVYIRGIQQGIIPLDSSKKPWSFLAFKEYCRREPAGKKRKYLQWFTFADCEGKIKKTEGFRAGDIICFPEP